MGTAYAPDEQGDRHSSRQNAIPGHFSWWAKEASRRRQWKNDRVIQYNDQGLVPAIAQDHASGKVLMLAWMDGEALRRTLETRLATYWSRSRQTYWVKGESSGHTQHVREVRQDCDGDTILLIVDQVGPACHTGADTCFDANEPLLKEDDGAATVLA